MVDTMSSVSVTLNGEMVMVKLLLHLFALKKLLLMRRNKSMEISLHFGMVFGVLQMQEEVLERVESTGLPVESLHYHSTGPERGSDMGRSLVDAAYSSSIFRWGRSVCRYSEHQWIDPGELQNYNCIFSNIDMENANSLFREMYGSVGSFLYIVKTAIGSEQRVADEMYARLHGSGSLTALQGDIMSILHPTGMRGYLFVESRLARLRN